MDGEFHYHIVGIVAHRAGFAPRDASIIAYASQYVDHNSQLIEVKDEATGETYENYISQTMNILKPEDALIRIYPVFHFVPGSPDADTARRIDGMMHLLNTTPDGPLANAMMREAFSAQPEASRLYRIGIAAHAYADTWAHQNFLGLKNRFNSRKGQPLPNIGHADAKHKPDRVGRVWKDTALVEGTVDNNARFIEAARRIFEHFAGYTNANVPWAPVERDLRRVMRTEDERDRLDGYGGLASWLPKYDRRTWMREAIRTKQRGGRDDPHGIIPSLKIFRDKHIWREGIDRVSTHWYQFQEAVKAHQAFVLPSVADICQRMGLDIWAETATG